MKLESYFEILPVPLVHTSYQENIYKIQNTKHTTVIIQFGENNRPEEDIKCLSMKLLSLNHNVLVIL